jgi:hypothetical protein
MYAMYEWGKMVKQKREHGNGILIDACNVVWGKMEK